MGCVGPKREEDEGGGEGCSQMTTTALVSNLSDTPSLPARPGTHSYSTLNSLTLRTRASTQLLVANVLNDIIELNAHHNRHETEPPLPMGTLVTATHYEHAKTTTLHSFYQNHRHMHNTPGYRKYRH